MHTLSMSVPQFLILLALGVFGAAAWWLTR